MRIDPIIIESIDVLTFPYVLFPAFKCKKYVWLQFFIPNKCYIALNVFEISQSVQNQS